MALAFVHHTDHSVERAECRHLRIHVEHEVFRSHRIMVALGGDHGTHHCHHSRLLVVVQRAQGEEHAAWRIILLEEEEHYAEVVNSGSTEKGFCKPMMTATFD